jgi:hypothetical protein
MFPNICGALCNFQLVPFVDFSQSVRTTSSNGIVAFKSATSKSAARPASKATKSATSKAAKSATSKAAKSAAPQTIASESAAPASKSVAPASKSIAPASKSIAPASKSIAPASKSVAPASKSVAPASKSAAPKSAAPKAAAASQPMGPKPNSSQVTTAAGEDDQDSDEELAVGGMLDEDDSQERELAMLSPLKGSELRAAKKVHFYLFSEHELTFSQSILKANTDQDAKSRKRATIQNLPEGANNDSAWTRLVIPNTIRLLLAGEQPWVIGDDVIISELQKVWDRVYGRKIPFTIKKGTVPSELISNLSCLTLFLLILP